MKLKLNQIVDIRDAINGIMSVDRDNPVNLEAKIKFGLVHNFRKVKGLAADYDQTRVSTIKKNLSEEEKKKGNEARLLEGTPEHQAAKKELDEALEKEFEIDLWVYPETDFHKAATIPMVFVLRLMEHGIITQAPT